MIERPIGEELLLEAVGNERLFEQLEAGRDARDLGSWGEPRDGAVQVVLVISPLKSVMDGYRFGARETSSRDPFSRHVHVGTTGRGAAACRRMWADMQKILR